MTQYLALTYTADVDWMAPEQADEFAEYVQFGVDNAERIRAAAVLHPTSTATVVRVEGARGGNVITTDGPYAETKEALTGYYLLEAADVDEAVRIAAAHLPYRVPDEHELADRLPAVCGVIHSLYTAGHAPIGGGAAYDVDACAEAVRLAELVVDLLTEQPMPAAVLALLLLTEGRRPARLDEGGDVVTLDRQDRGRWDSDAITRGIALLNESLHRSHGQADAYQLQAAIAAEHARAASYNATDWTEILRLYDLLVSIAPSPAAALGRAVAAAEAGGPATGLALLADLAPNPRWHSVRAELLARQGRYPEAADALAESLEGPASEPERRHRQRRRETFLELAGPKAPDAPDT